MTTRALIRHPMDGLHRFIARAAGAFLNGRGDRARLSILVYHRIAPLPDPLGFAGVPRADFDWQMRLVSRCFNPLVLGEAVERLRHGTLPPRALCVTFDDGYADNAQLALPVLLEHGVPATFFVASGFLDRGCMFNDIVIEAVRGAPHAALDLSHIGHGVHALDGAADRVRAINALLGAVKHLDPSERDERVQRIAEASGLAKTPRLMMSQAEVRSLVDAGMEVGAHTVNHPILKALSTRLARAEIADGRDALAEITGQSVEVFAYPNGKPDVDYGHEHVTMVRELGFRAAVCTVWGSCHRGSDPLQLPRFTPWDAHPTGFLARLIGNWRRDADVLA